jgi:hypothetical protein
MLSIYDNLGKTDLSTSQQGVYSQNVEYKNQTELSI